MQIKHDSRSPQIYGTGLIALDIVLGHYPEGKAFEMAGGTCGNVLTILSYLGWKAFPISRLDSSSNSIKVSQDMAKWGVYLDFVNLNPTATVPVITQETVLENGEFRHRFYWKNCPKCGSWLPNYKAVTLEAISHVKEQVEFSDVFFFDRTSPAALDLARCFKKLGSVIFFEPSAKSNPKQLEMALGIADVVKYSNQRFQQSPIRMKRKPLLEIQTLNRNGLRYRIGPSEKWSNLPAYLSQDTIDTCGCGDWTTAGIIAHLCTGGIEKMKVKKPTKFIEALRFGQALGAWNSRFEGARSGMYHVDKYTLRRIIPKILRNGTVPVKKEDSLLKASTNGLCPSCLKFPSRRHESNL